MAQTQGVKMANTKQQQAAADRRLVIIKLMHRAKVPCTTKYLMAMLASPWWDGASRHGKRLGKTYIKKPQDIARDLTNMKREGLLEKIVSLHYVGEDPGGPVVQRIATWQLTVAGRHAAKKRIGAE
jgi:hypothetical protein